MLLLCEGRNDVAGLSEPLAAPCPANGTWGLTARQVTHGSDPLPGEGAESSPPGEQKQFVLMLSTKHMVIKKKKKQTNF